MMIFYARHILALSIFLVFEIQYSSASPHSRFRMARSELKKTADAYDSLLSTPRHETRKNDMKNIIISQGSKNDNKLIRRSHAQSPSRLQGRLLVGTITSTQCPLIRTAESFAARLDLYYLYQIEFSKESEILPDLEGINRAVASSLAQRLDECNEEQRPIYAIQLLETEQHTISSTDICTPQVNATTNQCLLIRGLTSILLDDAESTSSDVIPVAYEVLQRVFRNVDSINHFTWAPLVSAQLQGRIGENLILLHGDAKSGGKNEAGGDDTPFFGTTTMAIIFAAAIAFFLTISCFLLASRYRHVWDSVFFSKRRGCHPTVNLAYWHSNRRRYWTHLESESFNPGTHNANALDEDGNPRWTVTNHIMPQESLLDHYNRGSIVMMAQHHQNTQIADRHENTIITRHYHDNTVSDLTGDTGSIKSSLKMDSIPEGLTEASYDEELAQAAPVNMSSSSSDTDEIERERYSHYEVEGSNPDVSEDSIDTSPYASCIVKKYSRDSRQDLVVGACETQSQDSYKTEDAPCLNPSLDSDAETPIRSNRVGDIILPTSNHGNAQRLKEEEENVKEVMEHDLSNEDLLVSFGKSAMEQLFEEGKHNVEREAESYGIEEEDNDSSDKNDHTRNPEIIGAEEEMSTIIHEDTDDDEVETHNENSMNGHPGGTHMLESRFHELFEDPEFSTSLDDLNIGEGLLDKRDDTSLQDLTEQDRTMLQPSAIISDDEYTDEDYKGDDEQESESCDGNGFEYKLKSESHGAEVCGSERINETTESLYSANRQPLRTRDMNTEMEKSKDATISLSQIDKENSVPFKTSSRGIETPSKASKQPTMEQSLLPCHDREVDDDMSRAVSPDGCWYFSKKDYYLDLKAEQDIGQGAYLEDTLLSPFGVRFLAESPEKEYNVTHLMTMKPGKTVTNLHYSEDSSLDCTRPMRRLKRSGRSNSLQDLRLLGPVVTDSTSEDISLLGQQTADESLTNSPLQESNAGDNENDDDSGIKLGLPVPYLVARNTSKSRDSSTILDSSILSDITNPQDTDTSYCSVPFKEPGSEMSI